MLISFIILPPKFFRASRWQVVFAGHDLLTGPRFQLQTSAFRDPAAYFHQYAAMAPDEANRRALAIWRNINLRNLEEHILPTKRRARLILQKAEDHRVTSVSLRKL